MNGKFKTLALAMTAVRGPFDGLTAFIAFATAHIGMYKYALVELDYCSSTRRTFWLKDKYGKQLPVRRRARVAVYAAPGLENPANGSGG